MKVSSYTTALEPGCESALAFPSPREHDLYLATLCHTLSSALTDIIQSESEETLSYPEDIFHFGILWNFIGRLYPDLFALCQDVVKIREMLKEQKNEIQAYIESFCDKNFQEEVLKTLDSGYLFGSSEGAGAAYFLYDKEGQPRYVIKPVDEDIFCLNNRKELGSPLNETWMRVRDSIPLYRSAQTDTLAYLVALHMGLESITPKTSMMLVDSESFFDISDRLNLESDADILSMIGAKDTEKLCSVQEYVPNSVMMQEMIYQWLQEGKTEDEIGDMLCFSDFEKANLLIWTSFDTDAHLGNFVLYPKDDGTYGIQKVDNGLSFPEKNRQFKNFLTFFSIAQTPLSSEIKEKIRTTPKEAILSDMDLLGMSSDVKTALIDRAKVMQELAERDGMSYYEMNLRLMLLGQSEQGSDLALKEMPLQDLEILVGLTTASTQETPSS